MKIRRHILAVLMKKDIKLLLTNKNVLIMLLLPLGFSILYQFIYADMMDEDQDMIAFVLSISTLVNLCAIPLSGLGMMIAEEKEKHTLRVLMLNDVSALEYLLSKLLVVLCTMELVGILIFFVTMAPVGELFTYLFATTITSITLLLFGAVIGLISKDQMSTGTLSTPVMVFFLIPPMMGQFNSFFQTIAQLVPTYALTEMLNELMIGNSIFTQDMLPNYLLILAWTIIGIGVFCVMYKRKRFDN